MARETNGSGEADAAALEAPPQGTAASLLAQVRELLVVTDAAGTIGWCNRRFVELTGASPGGRLGDLVAGGGDGEAARATITAVLDDRRDRAPFHVGALALRGKGGGSTLWLDAHASGGDGLVLWNFCDLTSERFLAAQAHRQGELLDTAQEFGRLGIWERQIPSGIGRWDRHVFRFWGLDPAGGTPDFDDAARHIHPDDRERMNYQASTGKAGRYSARYRVVQPDGQLRRIHSQWEVKNGPQGVPDRAIGVMMDDTEAFEEASLLGDVSSQLRLAVELGNIAIWRHDLATERIYYNDRAFALLQMKPRREGFAIAAVRAQVHPDDLPRVIASADKALATDTPTDLEARYRRPDGDWRTVLTRRVVERDAKGRPIAFVGVALDVSETVEQRRRAEELARRFDAASRAAGIGVWSATATVADGDWNEQMFALFDTFSPPLPPHLADWLERGVHPDDRARVGELCRSALREGDGPMEVEFRSLTRSGEPRWIVLRADVDRQAGVRRLLGVALDVTEPHLALDKLRDASERTRLITRYAGIGTWESRLDNTGEVWDEQMFALRGIAPREQALNREERLALVHPDDQPRVLDTTAATLPVERPAVYEFRVRMPDGRWRWLASRSAVVFGADGEPMRRVGVNWDITESKEAEGARQQAAIAEREVQAKRQFLSRMSHELRTPLNAVLGFTQLLQLEAKQAGRSQQSTKLEHIRAAGGHLLALIDDVLDLSEIESGKLRLETVPVDLAALIGDAIPLVDSLATQHAVAIRVGAVSGRVRADPARFRQVMVNLLSNAIKYNRRGGYVTVEAKPSAQGGTITISDTGRGLSDDQLTRLFEPFNRFGVEREGIVGTGIGLVIVKALVQGMGGTLAVSSAPGRGTVVEVTLPAAGDGHAPLSPHRREAIGAAGATARAGDSGAIGNGGAGSGGAGSGGERPALRSGRILYIEDNAVNVLLVEELVRSVGGLEIVSEATGAAGVARAKAERPDLVLVDLQLPDIDGFEVLRRLRADPATRAIACVALSANAMPDDIARGRAAGFSDYWTKPIEFASFLASLRRLFPKQMSS